MSPIPSAPDLPASHTRPLWRRASRWVAILTALALGAASAQPEPTPDDLSAFFGGLMPVQLEAHDVAGAVVTVVRDGEIVFAEGYGHADLDARAPVDPDTTLFRIGSVSKLFTYTAAMQLVERGELRLDEDVNRYLPEPLVPDAYGEPVTIAHLMTHTAGFEDRLEGLFELDASSMAPLDEVLREQLPARVRPPGELAAYSNHGVALLGLVVEEVSGQSWAAYVEDHVLGPLGMSYTTPRQPLPAALAPHMSGGYAREGGRLRAQPFTFVPLAPAGAVSASGTDMARFMIAHLQDGRLGEARILQEATAVRMKSRLFEHDPRLPGMAHGFYQTRIAGEPVVGHDGGMVHFTARLMLFPERDVGVFVSYNGARGAEAQEALARAFVARYFPHEPPPPSGYQPSEADLAALRGTYLSTRSVSRGSDKMISLVMTATLTPGEDGTVRVASPVQPPMTLDPVEPGLWRARETGQLVASDVRDGRPTLFLENVPVLAFQRLPWHATPGFHGILFGAAIVLLLSAVVAAPFAAVLHWRLKDRPAAMGRWARAVLLLAAASFLAFVVALAVSMSDAQAVMLGAPPLVAFLGALLPVAALLVAVSAVLAAVAWRRRTWSLAGRVHYSLVVVAGGVLVWQLAYWNLLAVPGFGAA